MPTACVVTNASGSAIERSTCVSAAKFTTASTPCDRGGDRVGVLDAGVHELDVEAREVLAPPGVRELVEHDDVVAVVAQAHAHEGRADEAGAAADEQLHDTATRVARYSASPSLPRRQRDRIAALAAQHAVGRPPRRAHELVARRRQDAAVDPGALEDLQRELVPRALAGAGDVMDAGLLRALGELDERAREVPGPGRAADLVGHDGDLVALRAEREHRVDEVPAAGAEQPRGAHDRVGGVGRGDELLAGELRVAVDAERRRPDRTPPTARAWSRRRRSPSRRARSARRPRPPRRRRGRRRGR